MNKKQADRLAVLQEEIRIMYEWRNIPHHVKYIEALANADHHLEALEDLGFSTYAYFYRLSRLLLRFRRKCYLVKFSDKTAPHHCRICSVPTGTNFRICTDCMAAGHIRPQDDVSQGTTVARPEPCPRLSAGSGAPTTTSSQRFLNRFGAGDSLKAATPFPRAMKNRFSQPRQLLLVEVQGDFFSFPPAYALSPKVAGGPFLSVAVLVTPPLSPMGGTFPLNMLSAWSVKGAF